jgi:peptidoglycan/LPS O-acetylase OafA/YrhL
VKLGQAFDPRNNALNAFRLVLAASVIVNHSYPLTGTPMRFGTASQLLTSGGVDGFFALSGFLITSSWLRHPQIRDYVVARALRILPGFYVCLVVTAFVIAPVGVAIQGGQAMRMLLSAAPFEYVLANSAVATLKVDVAGTPQGIPYPGSWNSSLWTLVFELLCYLAVALLGLAGLANRRWVSVSVLVLSACAAALLPGYVDFGGMTPTQLGVVVARFAVMFAAGALLYQMRDVVPARWSLVLLSVIVVLAAAYWLPDYRVIAAVPFAYALIVAGALIRNRRLSLRTDLSYGVYIYGFPVQQLLIISGLGILHPLAFAGVAITATLPLAALSWFLIEKRAMALKRRLIRKKSVVGRDAGDQPLEKAQSDHPGDSTGVTVNGQQTLRDGVGENHREKR